MEKCRNVSGASKQHSLNNKSQKDISKVIETIDNKGEKGIYQYIHHKGLHCAEQCETHNVVIHFPGEIA